MQKHQSKKYFYKEFSWQKKIPIRFITLMKNLRSVLYMQKMSMITYIYTYVIILMHSIQDGKSKCQSIHSRHFWVVRLRGKLYLLHPFCIKKIKHFFFFLIKKVPVSTASPSLVKSLLQERRRWKFQIKRGNREIGRRRWSSIPGESLWCKNQPKKSGSEEQAGMQKSWEKWREDGTSD